MLSAERLYYQYGYFLAGAALRRIKKSKMEIQMKQTMKHKAKHAETIVTEGEKRRQRRKGRKREGRKGRKGRQRKKRKVKDVEIVIKEKRKKRRKKE